MIELKHITPQDSASVIKYITNPEVTKFLTWKPYKKDTEVKRYFDYAVNCIDFPDEIFCIYFNKDIIGTAHLLLKEDRNVQMGFGILPEFWNKKIGSKIAIKLIEYIQKTKWCKMTDNIIAVIHNQNEHAQKIFEKLNFTLDKKNVKSNFDRYILNLNSVF